MNEDFVTYEIGKKLKEKEYPHSYNRFGYRPIYSDNCTIKYISDIGAYEKEYYGENIPCPTINEVLKWLREEKKMHMIMPVSFDECYWWEVRDCNKEISEYTDVIYASYEEAALAGIEYVLNLI